MTNVYENAEVIEEETIGTKNGREAAERFAAFMKEHGKTLGGAVVKTAVTATVATVTTYLVKKHLLDE